MKKLDTKAILAYNPDAFTLIPLHKPSATRTHKGVVRKVGKAPLDPAWTTKTYDTRKVVARCIADNRNVGVRLTQTQLVIDVDPRNGGDEGFMGLCLDLGLDESAFPHVITGSGGSHYYMTKPADILVRDTLDGYDGVEFKSKGRQVVAAGSIHPDTGKYYRWDSTHPSITKPLPPAPKVLLNLIKRPQPSALTGGGQYDQEQIAAMLKGLDPEDYKNEADWRRVMMACHHASNGDARSEFIEWSILDPDYADQAEIIGRRWDSCTPDKEGGISYRTLNYELQEGGAGHLVPAANASDDFGAYDDDDDAGEDYDFDADEEESERDYDFDSVEDEAPVRSKKKSKRNLDDDVRPENPNGFTDEGVSALEKLNEEYCVAVDGSKARIIYKQLDPVMKRDFWIRMAPTDFTLLMGNKRVMRDTTDLPKNAAKFLPMGKAWLEWAGRKDVKGVIFDPEVNHPGYLNLWTGWAYEPSRDGEWTRLQELMFEVLADGDDIVFEYVMNWCAWMIQNPNKQAETAIVFKGGMGVGKGTLGNALARIIGRHALSINSPELLVGRFNSHLQDIVFLFADEAIKPYDKAGESRLKSCITEPILPFEGKGRDTVSGTNVLHVMMASNEGWVIPAGLDERRFLVSNANGKWLRKFDKFTALHEQLSCNGDSGYRRMLFDLKKRELPPGWHPRHLPTTQALIDQKIMNLPVMRKWLFECCMTGILPFETFGGVWDEKPVRFFAEEFRTYFGMYCRENGISPGGSGRSNLRFIFTDLRGLFPDARTELRDVVPAESTIMKSPSDGRAQSVEIPSLPACRQAFEHALGGKVRWPTNADDEADFG